MGYWSILGIDATTDLTTIKRAYVKQLKDHHPEDDPEGFKRLRQAYEMALNCIDNPVNKAKASTADVIQGEDRVESEKDERAKQDEAYRLFVSKFMEEIEALYGNRTRRNDKGLWEELLNDERLWNLEVKKHVYYKMSDFLHRNHEINYDVLVLLNEHFRWAEELGELIYIFFDEEEIINKAQKNNNTVIEVRAAQILYDKSVDLQKSGKLQEARAIYNQILSRFKESDHIEINIIIAKVLFNVACCSELLQMATSEEILAIYNEIIDRFIDSDNIEINAAVLKALHNKSAYLANMGKLQEVLQSLDQLVSKLRDSESIENSIAIAESLYYKVIFLKDLNKQQEAIDVCEHLIAEFKDSDDKEIILLIAQALFSKALGLRQLKKSQEAIAIYDELINRFIDSVNIEINIIIAKSLYNKGLYLSELEKVEDAIRVYNQLIAKFKYEDEEIINVFVGKALSNKAVHLHDLERKQEAIESYNEFIHICNESKDDEIKDLLSIAKKASAKLSKSIANKEALAMSPKEKTVKPPKSKVISSIYIICQIIGLICIVLKFMRLFNLR